MTGDDWAHQRSDATTGLAVAHGLSEHLLAVAALARAGADGYAGDLAHLAGQWHDLGKYRPGFQRYIRQNADAHIEGRVADRDKTHSAAGALHALREVELRWPGPGGLAARALAYVIAGHHAGLSDALDLDDRLRGSRRPDSELEYRQALDACRQAAPDLLAPPPGFDPVQALRAAPGLASGKLPLARALWVRMLFSALVDADFLDTEAFMNPERSGTRQDFPPLADYLACLDRHLDALAVRVQQTGRADDVVMRARGSVLQQCRDKAALPPGVFTLTVPTGGGKTLSSLAFALRHAVAHGRRRVVYAIPYTSIIEQTAEVFAGLFGPGSLVEHHSQAEADERRDTLASRLACENWDAPLVVTTNVQVFESLFAARTSRCRKLHNLVGSVIVLDEAQLLPPDFLQPILDTLNVLVAHYGVTLLLCTATQPALTTRSAFDARRTLRGLPEPTPIIGDEAVLFTTLERVAIRWPADLLTPTRWEPLVEELQARDCVLVIVNTRKDAHELTQRLPAGTLHLSAAMCGAHRKAVIDAIHTRLQARRAGDPTPLRVVSTQLVEAGVDLDFPVVYRALAGLDSIAQAAGRCNREGRLARGEVVVFVREIPRTLGGLRAGVEATRSVLARGLGEVPGPRDFLRYFEDYYRSQRLDRHDIVADLQDRDGRLDFKFKTAAKRFKLVDDQDQATLIVPWQRYDDDPRHAPLEAHLQQLGSGATDRWLLRAVQRYTVNARQRDIDTMQSHGDVKELVPGLYLLTDELRYDRRFGLLPKGAALDPETMVQ